MKCDRKCDISVIQSCRRLLPPWGENKNRDAHAPLNFQLTKQITNYFVVYMSYVLEVLRFIVSFFPCSQPR